MTSPPLNSLPAFLLTAVSEQLIQEHCFKAGISQIRQLSPLTLAYLGDAVYELYMRTYYLLPPRRLADYHNCVVAKVRAESQAELLQHLDPYLSESERDIVRRGRNAVTAIPKRLSPELYQQATGLEALFGYLYLQNPQRLNQLFDQLKLALF